jgi:outer membrane protein assembly factor BamB
MKNIFVKTRRIAAISLFLLLTVAMLLMACNEVFAQTSTQKAYSEAYLSVRPNPIGTGQELLINAWTSPQPPLESPTSFNGRPRHDYVFVFTKPSGATETVGPVDSYGEGTTWFTKVVDELGVWTLNFSWPGDEIFEACNTSIQFTVQQEQIPSYQENPLPGTNTYWERPINTDNRGWYTISGNWLMTSYNNSNSWQQSGGFNPYSTAPNTAHILWDKITNMGGLIGGDYGSTGSSSGSLSPPVIMLGYLYYTSGSNMICVNLRTGEKIWEEPGSFNIGVPTVGGTPELRSIGGTTYTRYNAYTGAQLSQISNATAGYLNWAAWDGQRMWIAVKEKYMICWNASKVVGNDWASGVVWNTTLPARTGGHLRTDFNVIVAAGTAEGSIAGGAENITTVSIALDCNTGEVKWQKTWPWVLATECCVGYGKLYQASISTGQLLAIDLQTGDIDWNLTMPRPWGVFASYGPCCAYGNLYWGTYDGNLWCVDTSNGDVRWHFNSGDAGFETPYGSWPFWLGPTVADGKVYAGTSEHSPTQPHIRGCRLFCVDAYTGNEVWNISGAIGSLAVADGYLVGENELDAKIYTFGKGETTTTVTAPQTAITVGTGLMITGTVMDQSPAQPDTPAISDADMSAWMEYLHMQKQITCELNGVPVQLTAVGADGQAVDLGTVTSDMSGMFKKFWTPTIAGEYTIIANFNGTESYWPSYAETAVGVVAASSSPSVSSSPATSPSVSSTSEELNPGAGLGTTTYIAIAAVIIIVIAVAVAALLLQRRK